MSNRRGIPSLLVIVIVSLLLSASCRKPESGQVATPSPSPSGREVRIVRLDPRLDAIVAPGSPIETLADGYKWTEGPVWNPRDNYLLFTNIPGNEVLKWQEGAGVSQFLHPSGYTGTATFTGNEPGANGLAYDPQGNLILCQHGDRRVARLNPASQGFTTIVDSFEGKRLNSPNDLVFKSNGDLYFTDPPYGLPKQMDDPARELDFCGVYRLSKSGSLSLLTRNITRPNGLAFSPDESVLYVASSDPGMAVWWSFKVLEDGTLSDAKIFFDATNWVKEGRKGLPDGMKVDRAGNLFATGPGGVIIFGADGTHLGTIETGVPTANCAIGEGGKALYITANTALLRVGLAGSNQKQ